MSSNQFNAVTVCCRVLAQDSPHILWPNTLRFLHVQNRKKRWIARFARVSALTRGQRWWRPTAFNAHFKINTSEKRRRCGRTGLSVDGSHPCCILQMFVSMGMECERQVKEALGSLPCSLGCSRSELVIVFPSF